MTDDAALWAATRAGDSRAFTALFVAHRDRVFRAAARLLDTASDADDAAAVAFFELWRRRDSVRLVDGSPVPWLLVTATNVARNHRRAARRYRALLDRAPRSHEDDPADIALDRIEADRRGALIRAHLRALPSADLDLLVLTALEGLPVHEAAAALGMRAGTARSRLSRARARLRAATGSADALLGLVNEEA